MQKHTFKAKYYESIRLAAELKILILSLVIFHGRYFAKGLEEFKFGQFSLLKLSFFVKT